MWINWACIVPSPSLRYLGKRILLWKRWKLYDPTTSLKSTQELQSLLFRRVKRKLCTLPSTKGASCLWHFVMNNWCFQWYRINLCYLVEEWYNHSLSTIMNRPRRGRLYSAESYSCKGVGTSRSIEPSPQSPILRVGEWRGGEGQPVSEEHVDQKYRRFLGGSAAYQSTLYECTARLSSRRVGGKGLCTRN